MGDMMALSARACPWGRVPVHWEPELESSGVFTEAVRCLFNWNGPGSRSLLGLVGAYGACFAVRVDSNEFIVSGK